MSSVPAARHDLAPVGTLSLVKFTNWRDPLTFRTIIRDGLPRPGLGREVNAWRARNIPNLWRGVRTYMWARVHKIPTHFGVLYLDKFTPNGRVALGLASLRVVTTAGAGYIVDAFQNSVELENMKYHAYGTGTTAEAVGDTALQTELTTQYATDNTRPTGTTTEGASSVVYRTVATLDPDSAVAITEHGILSQAATGGGVLLDRTQFSAVNVGATDETLQSTYDLTFTAGS